VRRLPSVTSWPEQSATDLTHVRDVLVRYVRSRVRDEHAAQDIVQDVLLAAAEATSREGDLLPYVLGIARHKCWDWQRAAGRQRQLLVARTPDEASDEDGPEELALRHEQVALARALLSRLGDRDAELLRLRMSGCSAQETGDALGMSAGAVRIAQHRALNALRSLHGETR
jgi:RNA polymerase sigma-70 factor (ECF subfamily)